MDVILNVAMPFFALIGCGYVAGWRRVLPRDAVDGVNSFVFYFALPAMLFMKMHTAPIFEAFDIRFVIAYSGGGLISYWLCILTGRVLFNPTLGESGLQGMGAAFGNVGYMGLPILLTLFGDAAVLPAVLVIIFDHVFHIATTTALIEASKGGQTVSLAKALKRVAIGLSRNPLIIATAAGLLWGLTHLPLPVPVAAVGNLLGNAAGPVALFALGARLSFQTITEGIDEMAMISVFKLAVHPIAVWILADGVLGLPPLLTATAVIQASMPIASNLYIMANAYNIYIDRSSGAIVLSTAVALVTVSMFLVMFTAY